MESYLLAHSPAPSDTSEGAASSSSAVTAPSELSPTPESSSAPEDREEPAPETSSASATAQRNEHLTATHRCPLHATADECKGVRIASKNDNIISRLVNPTITFNGESEKLRELTRGKSKLLPPTLYRTFYEISATLSSRVSKDTHVRHRENTALILRPGNAFQTVGEVDFMKNLTKEGIERHLVWNKKLDPSCWISCFDNFSHAKRRAEFHYTESKRIGQRITIAEISTANLVAATVHATCVSMWEILTKEKYSGNNFHSSVTKRQVDIPVWVNRAVMPEDGSAIRPKDLMGPDLDLWVCIKELRVSNLVDGPKTHSMRRSISANGHNYEWLALGRIAESRIMKVIPYDGRTFHMTRCSTRVRSADATDDWIFDFDRETWRLESEMDAALRAQSRKRKRTDEDEGSKSQGKRLAFSAIQIVYASG